MITTIFSDKFKEDLTRPEDFIITGWDWELCNNSNDYYKTICKNGIVKSTSDVANTNLNTIWDDNKKVLEVCVKDINSELSVAENSQDDVKYALYFYYGTVSHVSNLAFIIIFRNSKDSNDLSVFGNNIITLDLLKLFPTTEARFINVSKNRDNDFDFLEGAWCGDSKVRNLFTINSSDEDSLITKDSYYRTLRREMIYKNSKDFGFLDETGKFQDSYYTFKIYKEGTLKPILFDTKSGKIKTKYKLKLDEGSLQIRGLVDYDEYRVEENGSIVKIGSGTTEISGIDGVEIIEDSKSPEFNYDIDEHNNTLNYHKPADEATALWGIFYLSLSYLDGNKETHTITSEKFKLVQGEFENFIRINNATTNFKEDNNLVFLFESNGTVSHTFTLEIASEEVITKKNIKISTDDSTLSDLYKIELGELNAGSDSSEVLVTMIPTKGNSTAFPIPSNLESDIPPFKIEIVDTETKFSPIFFYNIQKPRSKELLIFARKGQNSYTKNIDSIEIPRNETSVSIVLGIEGDNIDNDYWKVTRVTAASGCKITTPAINLSSEIVGQAVKDGDGNSYILKNSGSINESEIINLTVTGESDSLNPITIGSIQFTRYTNDPTKVDDWRLNLASSVINLNITKQGQGPFVKVLDRFKSIEINKFEAIRVTVESNVSFYCQFKPDFQDEASLSLEFFSKAPDYCLTIYNNNMSITPPSSEGEGSLYHIINESGKSHTFDLILQVKFFSWKWNNPLNDYGTYGTVDIISENFMEVKDSIELTHGVFSKKELTATVEHTELSDMNSDIIYHYPELHSATSYSYSYDWKNSYVFFPSKKNAKYIRIDAPCNPTVSLKELQPKNSNAEIYPHVKLRFRENCEMENGNIYFIPTYENGKYIGFILEQTEDLDLYSILIRTGAEEDHNNVYQQFQFKKQCPTYVTIHNYGDPAGSIDHHWFCFYQPQPLMPAVVGYQNVRFYSPTTGMDLFGSIMEKVLFNEDRKVVNYVGSPKQYPPIVNTGVADNVQEVTIPYFPNGEEWTTKNYIKYSNSYFSTIGIDFNTGFETNSISFQGQSLQIEADLSNISDDNLSKIALIYPPSIYNDTGKSPEYYWENDNYLVESDISKNIWGCFKFEKEGYIQQHYTYPSIKFSIATQDLDFSGENCPMSTPLGSIRLNFFLNPFYRSKYNVTFSSHYPSPFPIGWQHNLTDIPGFFYTGFSKNPNNPRYHKYYQHKSSNFAISWKSGGDISVYSDYEKIYDEYDNTLTNYYKNGKWSDGLDTYRKLPYSLEEFRDLLFAETIQSKAWEKEIYYGSCYDEKYNKYITLDGEVYLNEETFKFLYFAIRKMCMSSLKLNLMYYKTGDLSITNGSDIPFRGGVSKPVLEQYYLIDPKTLTLTNLDSNFCTVTVNNSGSKSCILKDAIEISCGDRSRMVNYYDTNKNTALELTKALNYKIDFKVKVNFFDTVKRETKLIEVPFSIEGKQLGKSTGILVENTLFVGNNNFNVTKTVPADTTSVTFDTYLLDIANDSKVSGIYVYPMKNAEGNGYKFNIDQDYENGLYLQFPKNNTMSQIRRVWCLHDDSHGRPENPSNYVLVEIIQEGLKVKYGWPNKDINKDADGKSFLPFLSDGSCIARGEEATYFTYKANVETIRVTPPDCATNSTPKLYTGTLSKDENDNDEYIFKIPVQLKSNNNTILYTQSGYYKIDLYIDGELSTYTDRILVKQGYLASSVDIKGDLYSAEELKDEYIEIDNKTPILFEFNGERCEYSFDVINNVWRKEEGVSLLSTNWWTTPTFKVTDENFKPIEGQNFSNYLPESRLEFYEGTTLTISNLSNPATNTGKFCFLIEGLKISVKLDKYDYKYYQGDMFVDEYSIRFKYTKK